jgi:hypothetical protein
VRPRPSVINVHQLSPIRAGRAIASDQPNAKTDCHHYRRVTPTTTSPSVARSTTMASRWRRWLRQAQAWLDYARDNDTEQEARTSPSSSGGPVR